MSSASAAEIVDQSNLATTALGPILASTVSASRPDVQTVTAGATGTLAEVDLQLTYGGTSGTFNLSIYNGDYAQAAGSFFTPVPGGGGTLIGTVSIPTSSLTPLNAPAGAVTRLDVSSLGFQVTSGQTFSLLATLSGTTSSAFYVLGNEATPGDPNSLVGLDYTRGYNAIGAVGGGFIATSDDRGFQTLVDVTTSASAALQPNTTTSQGFGFDFGVAQGEQVFVDPAMADGYDFSVDSGSPSILSALFPTIAGDLDGYQIYTLDGVFLGDATGGTAFNFGPDGVRGFELRGIDGGVDPSDPNAFVTGLTFTGPGQVDLNQTPIPDGVPEPATWALFLTGFGGLGATLRARRRRIAAA